MTCKTGSAVLLLSVLGVVTGAAANENSSGLAGNRGMSPIITRVPAQETPIVLAQADVAGTDVAPMPDYQLKICQETESTGTTTSAIRSVNPAGWLANVLEERGHPVFDVTAMTSIKTTLLEGTKHGEIASRTASDGRTTYRYYPIPNYVGEDQAVFLAEFEGKRYKIVVKLVVSLVVDFNSPQCPEPQLIKVNKPSTGSSGYDLNSVTVTFADLEGGAFGQTTGLNITLDTTAAGHNWYIDTTPWDNSEYLPTSNPYEWVAKAGTAAYGKMDMLSVLLHEYTNTATPSASTTARTGTTTWARR